MNPISISRPLAGLVAALALSAAGCGASGAADPATRAGGPDRIRRGALEDRFLLTGELTAVRSRQLTTPRTPTWSVTIEWMAAEGTTVRPGDPVVQFDSSSVVSNVEDRRLAVIEASQELARTRVDHEGERHQKGLDVRLKEIARDRAALEAAVPASLLALRDYQDKQLALEEAEAALDKSRRDLQAFEEGAVAELQVLSLQLEKAERGLERAEASLEELTLEAPAGGVLLHGTHPWEGRKWQVGDAPWAGTTVAEVPDLSRMEVQAWLSDVDDGEVIPGMPARCVLDTYPVRPFAGRVREVTEVAEKPDRNSSRRFFRVGVALDDIDPDIMRPGMSVKVEVIRHRWENALLVPRERLDLSGRQPRLLLAGGGSRTVSLQGCGPAECALAEGAGEGSPRGSVP